MSSWMTWKPVWRRSWVWKGRPWWMRTPFWPWGDTSRESPSICKRRNTALVPGSLSEQKSWDPSLTNELVGKMKEWGMTAGSTWRWFSLSNNVTLPRVSHGKDCLLSCVVIMTKVQSICRRFSRVVGNMMFNFTVPRHLQMPVWWICLSISIFIYS